MEEKQSKKLKRDFEDDKIRRGHYYEIIKNHAKKARFHISEMEKLAKYLSELNITLED